MRSPCGVVVPIRSFDEGKTRLAGRLDARERHDLLERMADRVADAAESLPTIVVSSAAEVADWARARGLTVLPDPGTLDAAANAGREHFRRHGAGRVAIVHADLPLVDTLAPLVEPGDAPVALLAPCHRRDGTPALSLPAGVDFGFSYGPGSFARHRAEALRLGLDVVTLDDHEGLRRDVDSVDDLEGLPASAAASLGSPLAGERGR